MMVVLCMILLLVRNCGVNGRFCGRNNDTGDGCKTIAAAFQALADIVAMMSLEVTKKAQYRR